MKRKAAQANLMYLLCCLLFPAISFSQTVLVDEAVAVPVDGGLSLLIIAGAGYGAKKIRKAKLNKNNI